MNVFQNSCRREVQKWSHTEGKLKQNKISLPFGADCKSQKLTGWSAKRRISSPSGQQWRSTSSRVQSQKPIRKNRMIHPILKVWVYATFAILIQWCVHSLPQQCPHSFFDSKQRHLKAFRQVPRSKRDFKHWHTNVITCLQTQIPCVQGNVYVVQQPTQTFWDNPPQCLKNHSPLNNSSPIKRKLIFQPSNFDWFWREWYKLVLLERYLNNNDKHNIIIKTYNVQSHLSSSSFSFPRHCFCKKSCHEPSRSWAPTIAVMSPGRQVTSPSKN